MIVPLGWSLFFSHQIIVGWKVNKKKYSCVGSRAINILSPYFCGKLNLWQPKCFQKVMLNILEIKLNKLILVYIPYYFLWVENISTNIYFLSIKLTNDFFFLLFINNKKKSYLIPLPKFPVRFPAKFWAKPNLGNWSGYEHTPDFEHLEWIRAHSGFSTSLVLEHWELVECKQEVLMNWKRVLLKRNCWGVWL